MVFSSPELTPRDPQAMRAAPGRGGESARVTGPAPDAVRLPADTVMPRRLYVDAVALVVVSLGCVLAGFGVLGMAYARFAASFRLMGDPRPPTPQEIGTYEAALTLSLVAGGVALVAAVVRRRTAAIAAALGALAVIALAASVFAVPAGRWDTPEPAPSPTPQRFYEPCYSGSGDCPGG
ncbi:MAG: DUF6234 family protein [Kineosporiaceae bacterium]